MKKVDNSVDSLDFDCTKKCSRCGQVKDWDQFGFQPKTGRIYSRCKVCGVEHSRENPSSPFVQALRRVKFRAKARGLAYDLTDNKEWLRAKFNGVCELTGIPFDRTVGRGKGNTQWNAPSIDRIKASEGYTRDNVRVILWCLNAAFNSWGEDRFEIVARAWLENRK